MEEEDEEEATVDLEEVEEGMEKDNLSDNNDPPHPNIIQHFVYCNFHTIELVHCGHEQICRSN